MGKNFRISVNRHKPFDQSKKKSCTSFFKKKDICFYDQWSISALKLLKLQICHQRFKGSRSLTGPLWKPRTLESLMTYLKYELLLGKNWPLAIKVKFFSFKKLIDLFIWLNSHFLIKDPPVLWPQFSCKAQQIFSKYLYGFIGLPCWCYKFNPLIMTIFFWVTHKMFV